MSQDHITSDVWQCTGLTLRSHSSEHFCIVQLMRVENGIDTLESKQVARPFLVDFFSEKSRESVDFRIGLWLEDAFIIMTNSMLLHHHITFLVD
jgi:hypothetical protein